jgi:hypothetical protein
MSVETAIKFSVFGMLVGILLSFGLSVWGWSNLYNQRYILGAALIGCCLGLASLSLWFGSLF